MGNGTLAVASSDAIVVANSAGSPELVLAYVGLNVLVGYAQSAVLATTNAAAPAPQAVASIPQAS